MVGSLAASSKPQTPGICTIGGQHEAPYAHLHSDESAHLDGEEDLHLPEMPQHPEHGFELQLGQDLETVWKSDREGGHSMDESSEGAWSTQQTGSWSHAKAE